MNNCINLTTINFSKCTLLKTIGDFFMFNCKNIEKIMLFDKLKILLDSFSYIKEENLNIVI